jgi:glycerol-3-phosphate acyltransferase PlsY
VIAKAVGQLLITGVPLAIVKVVVWLVLPILLDAVSVAALVPAVVGVPLIRPFVAMFSPLGRLDPPKISGAVPLAVTVLLNASPTVPLKELVDVNCGP